MATKAPNMTKPLVLAVVLVVFGGFAYWLEYGKKPKDQAIEADAKKVLLLKGAAVTRLEFFGASAKPENAAKPPLAVSLTCESLADKLCKSDDASRWQLVAPLKAKADDSTVNSVLKNFANLVSNESIDLGTETPEKRAHLLKDYGLDAAARANPATRRVSVSLEGGNRITAYFGVKHPIGDNVFTLVQNGDAANETKIFVVPDWQLSIFDQKTSYFRDKNLFGLSEKEVTAFTLAQSKKIKGKLEGTRSADGKTWTLKQGTNEFEGDVDTVDAVLSAVVHLAAKDVVAERRDAPEAKSALAGAKATYDLRFSAKAGEKHLRFLEKKKDAKSPVTIYATIDDQDPVYEVDPYGVEKVEKTLDELRAGKMISVTDRYAIGAIDVENFGAVAFKQHIEKEPGGVWMIGGTPAGRGKIEAVLDRLTSKTIVAYSGAEPKTGILKMTFRKAGDAKSPAIADIEFWTIGSRLYAKNLRSPKKEVVELASDFIAALPWKPATLLEPTKEPTR